MNSRRYRNWRKVVDAVMEQLTKEEQDEIERLWRDDGDISWFEAWVKWVKEGEPPSLQKGDEPKGGKE